jgi:23S rRNA pseudouridine1911/1915/1917 synthase
VCEKIIIDYENCESIRIDLFLAKELDNFTRNRIQKLIKDENIFINGKVINSKKQLLKKNDEIKIVIPELKKVNILPEKIPLDIIYQDDDVIIVNKKKGMVVHPANGNYTGTLVNALLGMENIKLSGINGELRPGIVHRIDKDTSGLIIVAKNDIAHNFLAKQFEEHSINREYFAVCYGSFAEKKGRIKRNIGRHDKDRKKFAVVSENKGKIAITNYEVIDELNINGEIFSILKLKLETGRTHQIRVHMSYLGHSILGDEVYGKKKKRFGIKGQMLHAKKLGFIHPTKGEYMEFESRMPSEISLFLRTLF